jgi:hypothetical protein
VRPCVAEVPEAARCAGSPRCSDCRSVVRAASPTGEAPAVGNARLEASGVMERTLLDIERLSKIERL